MYNTDKDYWHRYLPEYHRVVFSKYDPQDELKILEIGVDGGESIKMWADLFKLSEIHGVDICKQKPEWPVADNITYHRADQGNRKELLQVFGDKLFDIIVDDGSHQIDHQANSLLEGIQHLVPNSFYILEDIHTSYTFLPSSPLVLLLSLKHLRETNQELTDLQVTLLSSVNFKKEDIYFLNAVIKEIHTFKRSSLPLQCWQCHGNEFNYKILRCKCGARIYDDHDSMSFIIKTY